MLQTGNEGRIQRRTQEFRKGKLVKEAAEKQMRSVLKKVVLLSSNFSDLLLISQTEFSLFQKASKCQLENSE